MNTMNRPQRDRALGVPFAAGDVLSWPAAMTGSEVPGRFGRGWRLLIGWHEDPAQRLEAGGAPRREDDSDDDPEAEPAKRGEVQQVRQVADTRMQDPPQREQEQHGGHG